MMDELKKWLFKLIGMTDGLHAIIITDRDGVPVLKVATESAPELALRPSYLATFGMVTEQASKLGIGQNKSMVCMYNNHQVVHWNKLPLIVTLVADANANTGMILALETDLEDTIEELRHAVKAT
ncbi:unnamed protein product [Owenia fusiformis]|uniref:Uncharacterized protein n=1 Tax=Owenia fusiformis TaxID=6347 RepID=A0A8J1UKK7_OWEFU|nr:unnamed protein product [Owenia fusiformis]